VHRGFDGYLKRVNPAWMHTFGYTEQEFLSRPFIEFVHPEDREHTEQAVGVLAEGRDLVEFENRHLCRDGSARWLQWASRPVLEQGLTYAVARDVTDRRRREAEEAALRRVATLVARASSPEEIFATVTEEVGRLLEVDLAVLTRYDGGAETIVAGWSARGKLEGIGRSAPLGGRNVSTIVHDTRRPGRFEDYGEASGEIAVVGRAWGVRAIVGVPITVEGELRGVMAVASTTDRPLPGDAGERLASFTALLATAYANAEARDALRRVADEQAALRRVATLIARGTQPDLVFAAVAEEVGTLLPATELALVGRYLPDGAIQYVGAWSAVGDPEWLGARVRLGGQNVSTVVFETGQPGRVDHLDEEPSAVTALAREHGARRHGARRRSAGARPARQSRVARTSARDSSERSAMGRLDRGGRRAGHPDAHTGHLGRDPRSVLSRHRGERLLRHCRGPDERRQALARPACGGDSPS
jgi:PAS domain S-box-containing protein